MSTPSSRILGETSLSRRNTHDVSPKREAEQASLQMQARERDVQPIRSTDIENSSSPQLTLDTRLSSNGPSPSLAEQQLTTTEDDAYQEGPVEALLPPPNFKPFFTLVEDESGEYYHPTVHYLFSDDDPGILTDTTLEALELSTANEGRPKSRDKGEERYVILDMAADGQTVVSASSLSPNWQALKTTVRPAPSWGDSARNGNSSLLLTMSGLEMDALSKDLNKGKNISIDEMVARFGDRLNRFSSIMGIGREENSDKRPP